MRNLAMFMLLLVLNFSAEAFTVESELTASEFGTILNLSGRQRMLTQKMSKEVLLIALHIDISKNLQSLATTSALFNWTLEGLRIGDYARGLPPTTDKLILTQLEIVQKLWKEFYARILEIIKKKYVSEDDVNFIATHNLPLLYAMDRCVQLYEYQATSAGLKSDPGLAVSINLAGKQRMLSQKMSKEFLLVAYGYEVDKNRVNVYKTSALFERTLRGLVRGDKGLKLPATTQRKILNQLAVVEHIWESFQYVIKIGQTQSVKVIPKNVIRDLAEMNLPLLSEMNLAVLMYEKEAGKK